MRNDMYDHYYYRKAYSYMKMDMYNEKGSEVQFSAYRARALGI